MDRAQAAAANIHGGTGTVFRAVRGDDAIECVFVESMVSIGGLILSERELVMSRTGTQRIPLADLNDISWNEDSIYRHTGDADLAAWMARAIRGISQEMRH